MDNADSRTRALPAHAEDELGRFLGQYLDRLLAEEKANPKSDSARLNRLINLFAAPAVAGVRMQ